MKGVDSAVQLDMLAQGLVAPVNTTTTPPATADDDGSLPAELRRWLVQLRLLQAVPFAYLVADSELLPEESIRWFYLDRRWTDALVMGALSVGTVNSDDRTLLAARYDAIRDELDQEERQVRRPEDAPRLSGDGGPVSGFLLRSRVVAGWPAMHVRAFSVEPDKADDATYDDDDPQRLRLLRLERLAPAVLLCLFDGIPEVVHLEEPRQGVQFGFDPTPSGNGVKATLRARDAVSADYLPGQPLDVPFRNSGSGVVNIQALETKLPHEAVGLNEVLDSAEYALQLVRFPYRQVWGDDKSFAVSFVFRPTVSYQVLKAYIDAGVQP
jgi:hypothetical protein